MQELKCPKCGEVFYVDEQGYAQLASQIRDKEFEKELKRREELNEKKDSELQIVRLQEEKKQEEKIKKEMEQWQKSVAIITKNRKTKKIND